MTRIDKLVVFLSLAMVVLSLATGCADHRGSLPGPGHDPATGGHGVQLFSALVWLDVLCILGAGLCASLAFFSAVPNFTRLLWAGALGFLASLAVSLFVGAILPALPWIAGGLGLCVAGVVATYLARHGKDLWRRAEAKIEGAVSPVNPGA